MGLEGEVITHTHTHSQPTHAPASVPPQPTQSEEGKKGIKAVGALLLAGAVAAGAYLLNEQREKKPAAPAVPVKKGGLFSFGKPAPPPPLPPAKKFWAFGK